LTVPAFYPILDTDTVSRRGVSAVEAAREFLAAGIGILQFRHKLFYSREVFAELEAIAAMCARSGATLVVNDRADLARLTGAALHLGQDDLRPSDARRVIGAEGRIGFSTHNEAQLRAAASEPVDYVALGPIFGRGRSRIPILWLAWTIASAASADVASDGRDRRDHAGECTIGDRGGGGFGGGDRRSVSGGREDRGAGGGVDEVAWVVPPWIVHSGFTCGSRSESHGASADWPCSPVRSGRAVLRRYTRCTTWPPSARPSPASSWQQAPTAGQVSATCSHASFRAGPLCRGTSLSSSVFPH
jgi:hypothetical protein